jgi:hypothetical protein
MNREMLHQLYDVALFLGVKVVELRKIYENNEDCELPQDILNRMISLSMDITREIEPYVIQDTQEKIENQKKEFKNEVLEAMDLVGDILKDEI